jgi:hypothetical protein
MRHFSFLYEDMTPFVIHHAVNGNICFERATAVKRAQCYETFTAEIHECS